MDARLGSGTLTLAAGTLQVVGRLGNDALTAGSVAVGAGLSSINLTPGLGSLQLTMAGIRDASSGQGVINFVAGSGTLGLGGGGVSGQPAADL
jgi:hypothetical protein